MKISQSYLLPLPLLLFRLTYAKDCSGLACVSVYSGSNCANGNIETSYQPTCAGNCYVYPFGSLKVQGDGIYGTNCAAYSDKNCQNPLGSTGNTVFGTKCGNFGGGQSMKCYYKC
ncbi:hypothetical protein G7Y79_00030g064520 [Physcia stellaris]|nr:hypothetical protein G7Y79_00030g064520 [Physcia stellaris]